MTSRRPTPETSISGRAFKPIVPYLRFAAVGLAVASVALLIVSAASGSPGVKSDATSVTSASERTADCYQSGCIGLDPNQEGCSADAQSTGLYTLHRRGGLLAGGGTAYAELRFSPSCDAGWLRVRSIDFAFSPSAWNPGAPSVGLADANSIWLWTGMVPPSGGQICGGTHVYSIGGIWLRWWFVGCFSAPAPPAPATQPAPPPPPPTGNASPPPAPADDGSSYSQPSSSQAGSVTSETTYWEQEFINYPVNTFTDPHNASGMGTPIAAGQWVQVSCKVYDPTIQSVNPDGYWYRIASSPWDDAYYSPANTFMNGDPPGGPYTHPTDFSVPDC